MADTPDYYSKFWPKYSGETPVLGWLPIRYWNCWDFARSFSVVWEGNVFVFDMPFLEEEDEWAGYFDVSEIGKVTEISETMVRKVRDPIKSWRIPVSSVTLDTTRKSFLDPAIFSTLR